MSTSRFWNLMSSPGLRKLHLRGHSSGSMLYYKDNVDLVFIIFILYYSVWPPSQPDFKPIDFFVYDAVG
uniref:Uncharacterized protein n=1 Tax=Lepeophtheirus salmonis TaxID=72036 RepID=A0A0K2V428_LEPSM